MTQDELTEDEVYNLIMENTDSNGEGISPTKIVKRHNEIVAKLKAELKAQWKECTNMICKMEDELAEKDKEIEQIRTLKDAYIKDLAESIPKARVIQMRMGAERARLKATDSLEKAAHRGAIYALEELLSGKEKLIDEAIRETCNRRLFNSEEYGKDKLIYGTDEERKEFVRGVTSHMGCSEESGKEKK